MDLQAVLSEVDSWPVEDRIRLVQEVWDRLVDQGHEPAISDELKAELDRRLAAHEADPTAAIPWEQVEAEALRESVEDMRAGRVIPAEAMLAEMRQILAEAQGRRPASSWHLAPVVPQQSIS